MTDTSLHSFDDLVVELKNIERQLRRIAVALEKISQTVSPEEIRIEQPPARPARNGKGKGFKGSKEDLERFLKENCPTTWANMDEVSEFRSGDFLITFSYVDSDTYSKMEKEIKEKLGGYYSKKYKGFVIPRAREGAE